MSTRLLTFKGDPSDRSRIAVLDGDNVVGYADRGDLNSCLLNEALTRKMTERNLSYGEAALALCKEHPEFFRNRT